MTMPRMHDQTGRRRVAAMPILAGLLLYGTCGYAQPGQSLRASGPHHSPTATTELLGDALTLPTGSQLVSSREDLHFHEGIFYQESESGVHVVVAPLATRVDRLPGHTVPFTSDGERFYYVADTYYQLADNRYEVVAAPSLARLKVFEAWRQLPAMPRVIAYEPTEDASLQRHDQFRCHQWATRETGYSIDVSRFADPTDYIKAMSACLKGRGYTIQ